MPREPLLEVRDLVTEFHLDTGSLRAVDGVSLAVFPGQMVGLVGESGSGKSVTALSILRLLPDPPARIISGEVLFQGQDLLTLGDEQLRHIRGQKIAMVFQEPQSALNPVMRVGAQVAEALSAHRSVRPGAARARAIELMRRTGIPSPEERWRAYPHQLSGGMRQRVMLAMALICDPLLLIADEPTTALDTTLQAQVIDLIVEEQRRREMAVLFITHDLALVAESCDRLVVLYGGEVVEAGPTGACFARPAHPYTAALLRSIRSYSDRERLLAEIPGTAAERTGGSPGCRFADRCGKARDVCRTTTPGLTEPWAGRIVRCLDPLGIDEET